jgi:two-component system chemotaxis response regulator CheY
MAKFLIIDDSRVSRKFISNLIEEAGHEVVAEAANGLEGYDMYVQHKPDIATLDVTMPLMGGIGCLKHILEEDPKAKVVLISSVGKEKLIAEALQIGAKHFLTKPLDKEAALTVINSLVD